MNLADSIAPCKTPAALKPGALLPVARYRFAFRMQDDLRLPEFAGSLLRGQFGAALRRTACLTGAKTCGGCPLLSTCPYPAIFEAPPPATHHLQKFAQVPNAFVVEPPPRGSRCVAAGKTLSFSMVLVGRALHFLPLVVHSLRRALRFGLGRERAIGDLEELSWQEAAAFVPIWDAEQQSVRAHEPSLQLPDFAQCDTARLEITTPLRLKSDGRPLGVDEFTPRRLVAALVRRTELLLELHAGIVGLGAQAAALVRHAESLAEERELDWRDWSRYSSRQKQVMTLGGVVGTWTLRGDLRPLLPWLWLGQWLHVGKNATMGMGAYTLRI
jgi:hypothetical protein